MSRLFQPLALGTTKLEHRIAMAPLTRYRMDDDWNATSLSRCKCFESTNSEVFLPTDPRFSILRATSMRPRYSHHERGYHHIQKRGRLPQCAWYLVRISDCGLEGCHSSSSRERLHHLLPALAPRPGRSSRRIGISRLQASVFQCCSHHSTGSNSSRHDRR